MKGEQEDDWLLTVRICQPVLAGTPTEPFKGKQLITELGMCQCCFLLVLCGDSITVYLLICTFCFKVLNYLICIYFRKKDMYESQRQDTIFDSL